MSISSAGIQNESKESIRAQLAAVFTNRWPDAQTGANGPVGVILTAITEASFNINESLVAGYSQLFLETATGANLDAIAQQSGVARITERFASVTLVFLGQEGYVIPVGTLARDSNSGVVFSTIASVQINLGTASVVAQAAVAGEIGNVPANTITSLVNVLVGVSDVTNPASAFGGGGAETDAELRDRVNKTIATYGSFPLLTRQLYLVDGVTLVDVLENLSSTTSPEGLPPRSIAILINGGADQAIGQALYDYLPVGTLTHGSTSVQVVNPFGRTITYQFNRPTLTVVNLTIASATVLSDALKAELQLVWRQYFASLSGGRTITSDEVLIAVPDAVIVRYTSEFNNPNFNLLIQFDTGGTPAPSVSLVYNQLPELGGVIWT